MVRPLALVAVGDLPMVLGQKEHVDICGVVVAVGDKVRQMHEAGCWVSTGCMAVLFLLISVAGQAHAVGWRCRSLRG